MRGMAGLEGAGEGFVVRGRWRWIQEFFDKDKEFQQCGNVEIIAKFTGCFTGDACLLQIAYNRLFLTCQVTDTENLRFQTFSAMKQLKNFSL